MVGATVTEIVMLVAGNPATGQVLPGRSFGKVFIPATFIDALTAIDRFPFHPPIR